MTELDQPISPRPRSFRSTISSIIMALVLILITLLVLGGMWLPAYISPPRHGLFG